MITFKIDRERGHCPLHPRCVSARLRTIVLLSRYLAPLRLRRVTRRTQGQTEPQEMNRSDGPFVKRNADRQFAAPKNQPPLRSTRNEPLLGPNGSVAFPLTGQGRPPQKNARVSGVTVELNTQPSCTSAGTVLSMVGFAMTVARHHASLEAKATG